ncbi:hypothetical protein PsYK624_133360 [Phanerochaete sordida]|uniref:Uncharacterized protein n=1 Tax=Phanerochaete sordida TaxID=48140 RepID=A0A9P3GPE0_9APHY|nr:hypothetical protein PsYK624_133360 [Phanerochaete sordida]
MPSADPDTMIYWLGHEVIEAVMTCLIELSSFLLGLYIWYLALSFSKVELGLLSRQVKPRPMHAPYLLGRYALLAMLLTIVSVTPLAIDKPLASSGCAGIATLRLGVVTGDIALSASSCNLALRAMVLWKQNRALTWIIRCFSVAHLVYSLVLGSVGVIEQWDPDNIFCTIGIDPRAKPAFLAYFIYTVLWDVTILALTVLGMLTKKLPPELPLRSALLSQGIAYASVTILTCIPMAVMMYLQLNEAMNVVLLPLGCTISVIASSEAVASLLHSKRTECSRHADGRERTKAADHPSARARSAVFAQFKHRMLFACLTHMIQQRQVLEACGKGSVLLAQSPGYYTCCTTNEFQTQMKNRSSRNMLQIRTVLNEIVRQRLLDLPDLLLYDLAHGGAAVLVHVRRAAPAHELLRDRAEAAEDVGEAELEHRVAARLLLPEVEPALRAAVLVPRRAARGRVLERERRRAQALPDEREAVVAREQPQLLRGRDEQPAVGVEHGPPLRRRLVCARAPRLRHDDVCVLHDLEVRDAAQGAQVELVRERHREVSVLDGVPHEHLEHGDHRVEQLFVRAQLRKTHEP